MESTRVHSVDASFPLRPTSLWQLLDIPQRDLGLVDVARMNLVCAEGLPGTDQVVLDSALHLHDTWVHYAAEFTDSSRHLFKQFPDVLHDSEPLWRSYCLNAALRRIGNVHYCDAETDHTQDADWTKSDRHMLHGLLGPARHGTCSLMPVLFVAAARRLGYPMKLVHSPGHVFSRWDGRDDVPLKWREHHNIEFTGGFETYPDERYRHEPVEWTAHTINSERARRPWELYLRSRTPAEELASFLVQRGHALEALGLFSEAISSYNTAVRLTEHNGRHNDCYAHFASECRNLHYQASHKLRVDNPEIVLAAAFRGDSPVRSADRIQAESANPDDIDDVFADELSDLFPM